MTDTGRNPIRTRKRGEHSRSARSSRTSGRPTALGRAVAHTVADGFGSKATAGAGAECHATRVANARLIVIAGIMAAGKSTVAQALAERFPKECTCARGPVPAGNRAGSP